MGGFLISYSYMDATKYPYFKEKKMKCLSTIDPFATLIAIQEKKIETRSWKTNYRGKIAIHASKNINQIV